jgi:hypothetical protein
MGLQTLAGPTTRLSLLICPQRHISVLSRFLKLRCLGVGGCGVVNWLRSDAYSSPARALWLDNTKPKRMGAQLLCDCSPAPHASPCLACGSNLGLSQLFHTVHAIMFLS